MNRTEIVSRVSEYINDDSARYSILINGNWGCGKTYLYRNYILKEIKDLEYRKKDKKHNVYISLYGVSSISELSRKLLLKFISVNTSKTRNSKLNAKDLYKDLHMLMEGHQKKAVYQPV